METAFLPTICKCEASPEGVLTITFNEEKPGNNGLTVTGILASDLMTSRAIASLVVELREEVNLRRIVERDRKRLGSR
ncbi:MAG: DUF1652 domain-containing protein [Janthinobacterium lividum]